jgi:hypothetical protein
MGFSPKYLAGRLSIHGFAKRINRRVVIPINFQLVEEEDEEEFESEKYLL